MKKTQPAPARNFRIGTTSYVLPQDILPNVRFLAGKVQDVELLMFEVDDQCSPLLSAEAVAELDCLAEKHRFSYTVHMPLDLRLAANDEGGPRSLETAQRVLERTRPLHPWAYIVHLEGADRDRLLPPERGNRLGVDHSLHALESLAEWAGGAEYLALENVEHQPTDFHAPLLEAFPAALCLDIGHLWLGQQDPLRFLEREGKRARVVHLHGVDAAGRDHQSLACMAPERVDPVTQWLLSSFSGVLTLEVFSLPDFFTSMEALEGSLERSEKRPRVHEGEKWAGD